MFFIVECSDRALESWTIDSTIDCVVVDSIFDNLFDKRQQKFYRKKQLLPVDLEKKIFISCTHNKIYWKNFYIYT